MIEVPCMKLSPRETMEWHRKAVENALEACSDPDFPLMDEELRQLAEEHNATADAIAVPLMALEALMLEVQHYHNLFVNTGSYDMHYVVDESVADRLKRAADQLWCYEAERNATPAELAGGMPGRDY